MGMFTNIHWCHSKLYTWSKIIKLMGQLAPTFNNKYFWGYSSWGLFVSTVRKPGYVTASILV